MTKYLFTVCINYFHNDELKFKRAFKFITEIRLDELKKFK